LSTPRCDGFISANRFNHLCDPTFGHGLALTLFGANLNMFKISIIDNRLQRRLVVEGRLIEPWVAELRKTWRNASRDLEGRRLVVDVGSLTVISREGEDAIFDLMKEGAKFSCGGVLTRHLLKRLARRCRHRP
jgi:hypothetical protein